MHHLWSFAMTKQQLLHCCMQLLHLTMGHTQPAKHSLQQACPRLPLPVLLLV
jgi:hypothetical protein